MKPALTILAAAVIAAACAAAPATQSPSPSPEPPSPSPTAQAPAPATPTEEPTPELPDLVGEVPEELLLEIMNEASRATGVNLAGLTLRRAEAVTWSDPALGCPEPGESYIQVLVDGFWVVIEGNGETLDFRADQEGNWIVCPAGRGQDPVDEQQF